MPPPDEPPTGTEPPAAPERKPMSRAQVVRWALGISAVAALALVVIAIALVRISSHISTSACLSKVALEHPVGVGVGVLAGAPGAAVRAGAGSAAATGRGATGAKGASSAAGANPGVAALIARAKAAKKKRKEAIKSCG